MCVLAPAPCAPSRPIHIHVYMYELTIKQAIILDILYYYHYIYYYYLSVYFLIMYSVDDPIALNHQ